MDRDTIIDGLRMTMELCVFDPSTGEEIEPHLLNDISRATYDACKGALEILERLPANNSGIPNSSDTISRAKAIEALKAARVEDDGTYQWRTQRNLDLEFAAVLLETIPPAQPEHIRGRWIYTGVKFPNFEGQIVSEAICSECNGISYFRRALDKWIGANICPNCGADMRGEQDG